MTTIDLQVYAPIQDVSSARTIDGPNGSKTHAFSFIDGQGNIRLYDLDHGAVSNPVVDATNIAGHAKGLDMYFVDGTGVENLNYMVVADQGVGTNGVKANEKLFNHFGKQQSTEITCNRTIRNTEDVAMANNKLYGVRDYTTLGFGQLNEYDFTAGLARITSLQQPDQPRLTARLVDAKFAFSFPTKTNATYVVERLDDSLSSIWIPVTTIIGNGTPATYSCTFCNESPGMAWFRVKKQ